LISSLLGNDLPGPGTIYRSQNLEFHKAVELGDVLCISVTVKSKNPADGSVVFDCRAVNQRDEKIITGVAVVKAPTRKPSEAGSPYDTMQLHRKTAFKELIDYVEDWEPMPTAVCHPCSKEALQGALDAAAANLIEPILVGPEGKIRLLAEELGLNIAAYRLVDALHSHDAAAKARCLVPIGGSRSAHERQPAYRRADECRGFIGDRTAHGAADQPCFRNGSAHLSAAVVHHRCGHQYLPEPGGQSRYHKKCHPAGHGSGYKAAQVAILSALETVNPKIPATIDAAALCKMADRGQIEGALVDGPLAFDNAVSKQAAAIKGIRSPVAGEADILLTPDLEAGNMLAKQLAYLSKADSAGIVLGAKVPIMLTSRADSAEARLASCAVATAYAQWLRENRKGAHQNVTHV